MNYRPICDLWFLARAKLKGGKKYYGAYLGGFAERARALIGASINEPVLHVCGGMARDYPYRGGFGPNDKTLDIQKEVEPDYCQDARDKFPFEDWAGILIDPPYSEEDALRYGTQAAYPPPSCLVRNAIEVLAVGRKVGLIHFFLPQCPPNAKFVACVGVLCGFGNRIRCFSVFEKLEAAK